jgi:NADH oxidase (H2O2-forming)
VAGVYAALTAKRACPSASVAIVSKEPIVYRRSTLKSVISGFVKCADNIAINALDVLKRLKVKVLAGYEVVDIDHRRRSAIAKNKTIHSLKYDKIILATGSKPVLPQIKKLHGIFTIKWFKDAFNLSQYLAAGRRAFVDGGGFIGLEAAEAIARRGLQVTIVARSRILRKILEPDLSRAVTRQIEARGVKVITGATIENIIGERKVKYVLINGQKLDADIVVFARGVRPNTSLAARIGLQLAENEAIKTDNHTQSNIEGVYGVGDCAETLDFVSGKPVYRPIGSIAVQSAIIAGSNAIGVEKTYDGFIRAQYNKIFGIEILSIGLSTEEAQELGISAEAVNIKLKKPKYRLLSRLMPVDALMKVIIQKGRETILGWEAVGLRSSSWASYFFQELIKGKQSISDITELGFEAE